MEFLTSALDFFLHLDKHLEEMINNYGVWIYGILFLIIFVETGLVVMPFLPGDSLLFAAGSFAAVGQLNVAYIIILLFIAAVVGDSLNYYLGKTVGLKILHLRIGKRVLVKEKYINETHAFYEKYGPTTIILARFVPIIRTFAPFVAGIGTMEYRKFFVFNVIGGAVWVTSLTLAGYWLGQMKFVKEHFETVILAIIFISILPPIIAYLKARFTRKEKISA